MGPCSPTSSFPRSAPDAAEVTAQARSVLAGEGFLPDEPVDVAVIVGSARSGRGRPRRVAHASSPARPPRRDDRPPGTHLGHPQHLRVPMNPRARPVDDELVNLGLLLIGFLGALVSVLRVAGTLAAWASGAEPPHGGLADGFRVVQHPGDPNSAFGTAGISPAAYWSTVAAMVVFTVGCAWLLWRLITGLRHRATRDPRRLAGVATTRDVRAVGLQEGPACPWQDPAPVTEAATAAGCRLPARRAPAGMRSGVRSRTRP